MSTVTTDIKLGQKVRDKMTNFEGVVDHIYYPLHDAVKIGIQAPVGKDGKMGECYTLDAVGVEVVSKKQLVKPIESKPKIQLGSEVKCNITGYKGRVTAYIVYVNGCVQYKVQPKIPVGAKAEDYQGQRFPEGCLEVLSTPKKKEIPQKTGGPRSNGMSSRMNSPKMKL